MNAKRAERLKHKAFYLCFLFKLQQRVSFIVVVFKVLIMVTLYIISSRCILLCQLILFHDRLPKRERLEAGMDSSSQKKALLLFGTTGQARFPRDAIREAGMNSSSQKKLICYLAPAKYVFRSMQTSFSICCNRRCCNKKGQTSFFICHFPDILISQTHNPQINIWYYTRENRLPPGHAHHILKTPV